MSLDILPIDDSIQVKKAVQIASRLNANPSDILRNPSAQLTSDVTSSLSGVPDVVDQAFLDYPNMELDYPEVYNAFNTLKSTVVDTGTAMSSFASHTNNLIFGSNDGSIISGGIGSNTGQALSAIQLDNSFAALGGEGSATESDPCALFGKFLGSILGAGESLLNGLLGIAKGVAGLLAAVVAALAGGVAAVIGAALAALNAAVSAIREKISELLDMISEELGLFQEWLQKQINYGLGNFLAGTGLGRLSACADSIIDSVGTQSLKDIIAE